MDSETVLSGSSGAGGWADGSDMSSPGGGQAPTGHGFPATYPPPRTRQRVYKAPPPLAVPDINEDAAERKRVLNVLAQRRYSKIIPPSPSLSPTAPGLAEVPRDAKTRFTSQGSARGRRRRLPRPGPQTMVALRTRRRPRAQAARRGLAGPRPRCRWRNSWGR